MDLMRCDTINALCDALNKMNAEACARLADGDDSPGTQPDLSSLPTWGDAPEGLPDGGLGIYSWDTTGPVRRFLCCNPGLADRPAWTVEDADAF